MKLGKKYKKGIYEICFIGNTNEKGDRTSGDTIINFSKVGVTKEAYFTLEGVIEELTRQGNPIHECKSYLMFAKPIKVDPSADGEEIDALEIKKHEKVTKLIKGFHQEKLKNEMGLYAAIVSKMAMSISDDQEAAEKALEVSIEFDKKLYAGKDNPMQVITDFLQKRKENIKKKKETKVWH